MILDKYECKKCGKEMILEGDSKYLGLIDRTELNNLCKECFNASCQVEELRQEMEYEMYCLQGSYNGLHD